ncbi:MAG: alcohol dehydrogenase catalytic domain-containing protein [Planctomycetota bacterium]|jgi:threonine dehydrogenase-like Zn-dependent dehydrogenase|nr:alcohol dehydrogenase catalytic domain-containing protein [Planctomycetota bacterium]
MRGIVLKAGRAEVRDDLPEPDLASHETLIEVLVGGVCATDIALRAGYMNFSGIPGHEFVGRALTGPLAGQRVVGEINAGCGTCARCLKGDPRHCADRSVLGIFHRSGAFAERCALPTTNLLPVPDEMPNEVAVFVEPLAAALQIPLDLNLPRGARALVAGDGRLGLLCAHALHEAGLVVTVAGHHEERKELLPQGVRLITGLLEEGVIAHETFPVAVEATGNAAVLPRLIPWVAPHGTLVMKTTTERPVTLDLAPLVVNELRLVGSRCGRFEPALNLLAEGRLPLERLVQARYPLKQGDQALERAAQPGVLKVLLDVS